MYGPAVRCKRVSSIRWMRSRINVSGIVWGFFCQGVFGRAVHLFPSSGFLQAAQLLVRIGLSADQEGQGTAAWKLMHRQGRRPTRSHGGQLSSDDPVGWPPTTNSLRSRKLRSRNRADQPIGDNENLAARP
jgi:hypothetical protein